MPKEFMDVWSLEEHGRLMGLLASIDQGGSEDPVDWDSGDLWRSTFVVNQEARWTEGGIRYRCALARVGNELRRRGLLATPSY
jgi:hypothetical protein